MASKNGASGFEVPLRTAVLVFEGELEGAEVRCRLDVPIGLYLEYAKLANSDDPEELERAFRRFSEDILINWNLKMGGKAVSVHPDGMLQVPPAVANAILTAWSEQAMNVPLAETNSD